MYQRFLAFFTLKKRCFYTILVKIREVCQIMLANKHCKAINLWYYGNVPKKLGSYNGSTIIIPKYSRMTNKIKKK